MRLSKTRLFLVSYILADSAFFRHTSAKAMEGKDQIIQLGKVLREEQERGCDAGAVAGGVERCLTGWRLQANGALQHAPVQQTLELLAGYAVFDEPTRRARIGIALEQL